MYGDAGHVVAAQLDLAGVQAGPYLDAVLGECISDRAGAMNCSCRAVEGGEDAVAGSPDQVSVAVDVVTQWCG